MQLVNGGGTFTSYSSKPIDPLVLNWRGNVFQCLDTNASANTMVALQVESQYSPTLSITSGHAFGVNPLTPTTNLPFVSIAQEKDSLRAPLLISPQNMATNANGTNITMLPTAYPNNYLLNAMDIAVNGKLGYTTQKTITANNEIPHKKYVDDADALKLSLSGGTMTGAIDMIDKKITSSYVPIHNHDLTNKEYVDSKLTDMTQYSTTTQIKAFNDMANYYTKTDSDNRYRQTTTDITTLNNGTDSLQLTPNLLNLRYNNTPQF